MYKTLAIFFIVFLSSCSDNDVPRNILSVEKMKPILWQQLKAEIYTKENLVLDSVKNKHLSFENEKLQMQIFKNNNITKDEFYKSYAYYLSHEDKLGLILDSLIAQQTRANLEDLKGQYNSNDLMNTRNIFLEVVMKPKPIFTLNPDTLPKEKELQFFNSNSHNNFNVPQKFNPQ